ncbi:MULTISPECIES: phosphatase PAP2 family protein [unclassified Methylosinus]|uniref:phosphatase PAP2 family protein n=1 Tax=unclassified Methylosinus TaxID=2624500 RepID=UPI0004658B54|nr:MULTISPECIES: phosphatase PAP2 family protein [unclassified Methylosinus]
MHSTFFCKAVHISRRFYDLCLDHLRSRFVAVPSAAVRLSLAMMASAYVGAKATGLTLPSFPDPSLFVVAVVALDLYCRFASPSFVSRVAPIFVYSLIYIVATSLAGIFASYATQRLAMPLQDELFLSLDRWLGGDWLAFAHYVDDRPLLAKWLREAYSSMAMQIIAPVVLLVALERIGELRVYLLAFAIALTATIVIAAFLPASSAVTLVDNSLFHELRFGGRTPLDHLTRLRESAPLNLESSTIGGLLSFPSFHAVVGALTPLSLRTVRPAFYFLCVVDIALMAGTVTEGGHYFVDPIGGVALAYLSYRLAQRIERRRRRSILCIGDTLGYRAERLMIEGGHPSPLCFELER